MTHHTEILNYLIEKYGLKSYCEIGTQDRTKNFNKINCEQKICVDPDPKAQADFVGTSDAFFWTLGTLKTPEKSIDIFWIDGLHEAEQVKRDIINAKKYVSDHGFICLHDCNPPTEATACYPRGLQREWCGNVYKTICQITSPKVTINNDYGITIIRGYDKLMFNDKVVSWADFNTNRSKLLRLSSFEDAMKFIEKGLTILTPVK